MSNLYSSDWSYGELAKLGVDILDGDRGKEYPKETDFFENEYCLFLSAKNVTKSGFKFDHKAFITRGKDEKLRKGKLIRNDLVVTTRGTVGNVAYFDGTVPFENIRINSGMAIIRNVDSQIDSVFLNQLLHSFIVDEQLELLTSGSAQPQLTIGTIKGLVIPFPPLPEQQKIAKILTSVDGVVEKTQAQIDKLKDLKTGMMQELLTNGIGHTEFKDSPVGRIPAEWEVMLMRDICITKQGLQIPISERYTEPAENRFVYLTIKFINTGFNPSVAEYIENPSKRVVCDESDIILARTGATGKVVTGIKGVFHNNFFKVDYDRDKIRKSYFVHYLNSPFIQTEIKKRAGTTTIPDLNHGDFYALPLLLPTLDEQVRIAKILDANDDFIGVKTRKLEALISTKKALMQDLLTGKVRVKVDS